ncbi:unnamed protein product [Linum tenue]|uniref:Uncharacterized protein n=1 Tax=Linum tenue TaxID=586396 RepID=A0AAV0NTM2_9ROSI|nr:unnamed protein product [Linum tenue]
MMAGLSERLRQTWVVDQ